ncbi:hypothetical protein ACHAXA_003313 [Cyclostephanos tholiformis]|uniref:Pentacotripeptide-repeat region of PRORP domain-containing protein n=1 Tax=Cyclostephanos tholiformis TaxID=382380 RepID=A0ABD3SBA6_9STRA
MNAVFVRRHNIWSLQYKHIHRPSTASFLYIILLLSASVQAWAFQSSSPQYPPFTRMFLGSGGELTNNNCYVVSEKSHRGTPFKRSSWRVFVSIANSQSLLSDISSIIDERPSPRVKKTSSPNHMRGKKRSLSNQQQKLTLEYIRNEPAGTLTPSHLRSLCNSIRHSRMGSSLQSLHVLERILMEIDSGGAQQQPKDEHSSSSSSSSSSTTTTTTTTTITTTTFLKPIHVFSTLTALSNDIRSWKQRQFHDNSDRANRHSFTSHGNQMNAKDVQRLMWVVTTLKRLKNSQHIDSGCYTKDVPSFATMIAAEASRWEVSCADAALFFLNMVENEENQTNGWDPRLIGAVLDALARYGRAEDAQDLLGRVSGIPILSHDDISSNQTTLPDPYISTATTKFLSPSHAGLCYDALLRSWSKKALLLAQEQPENLTNRRQARKSNSPTLTTSAKALAQARHILLNHMPLQSELSITNRTYAAVLYGYSALGMGSESESFVTEIEALHLSTVYSKSPLEPQASTQIVPSSLDVACYNTVLHACSQSTDSYDVVRAERLFVAMKEQNYVTIAMSNSTDNDDNFPPLKSFSIIPPRPDFVSYSSMLNCFSKHHCWAEAENLLIEMCDDKSFRLSVACFLPIIQSFEASLEVDAPERVLSLIERSERSLVRPSRLLYIAALRCMRQHGRGEYAEIIHEKYWNAIPNRDCPDVYSHMLVLRAWERTTLKSDRQHASIRAESFLGVMEKRAEESLLPNLDVKAYNILMSCYARAGDADKAEQLLADLESSYGNGSRCQSVRPNGKSYSLVLKAFANSYENDAIDRAWKIMHKLGYQRETKSTSQLQELVASNLSTEVCNAMLKLFAKKGMASEAEEMLNKMDEILDGTIKKGGPDIQSYEAVLEALGRCKDTDASSRAEALVTRLEVIGELGGNLKPNLLIYNTLLNCYANAGLAGKAERLLKRLNNADSFSYGSTIKAIANSGKSQFVSIARAESLANRHGPSNEVIFSHRLKLCQKWGMGDEAENLLQQMQDEMLNPSVIHYTSALNAWAKSIDKNSLRRAEALFKNMEEKFSNLDRAAYHGLLLNYSTRGKSNEAEHLLRKILRSTMMRPNRATFTMVIDSYARSGSADAGQKAEVLLDQMRELHAAGNDEVEPDNVTYASVIRCKQVSKNGQVKDLTSFEKLQLMRDLQLETWPFGNHET